MSLDPFTKGVLQRALDGLENQTVDTAYAVSLLPEPWKSAWAKQTAELDAYYRGYRFYPDGWETKATANMRHYSSEVRHFLLDQEEFIRKPRADNRLLVENLRSSRLEMTFRALSTEERSWFVPVDQTDRWRDYPPKLQTHLRRLLLVHMPKQEADRLEPFADKLRSAARQFLFNAITRGDAHAGLD